MEMCFLFGVSPSFFGAFNPSGKYDFISWDDEKSWPQIIYSKLQTTNLQIIPYIPYIPYISICSMNNSQTSHGIWTMAGSMAGLPLVAIHLDPPGSAQPNSPTSPRSAIGSCEAKGGGFLPPRYIDIYIYGW